MVLVALGLGCYLGWRTVDISPTLFPAPAGGVYEAFGVWNYVETTVFVALLAAFAWLAFTGGSLLRRRWLVGLTVFGTCGATALMYACGWLCDPALMPGAIAGRLLYCASAGFVALWGELLCRMRPGRTLACVAAGYAVSFGICLLVANLAPDAALALRTVAPLLSGAALAALACDLPTPRLGERPAGRAAADRDTAGRDAAGRDAAGRLPQILPVRLFVGIGILGAIFVAANHLSETKTEVSTELYTLIAGVTVSLAILAVAMVAGRSGGSSIGGRGAANGSSASSTSDGPDDTGSSGGNFSVLYRFMTPLVIGCLLLTLVLQAGYQRYEAFAIGLTWAFYRIFTWTLWAHVGSRDPARGACAFCLGHIALTLISTAGELLCQIVDLSSVPLAGAAAAIIFVTVVTSALIMDEGSVARFFAARDAGTAPANVTGITDANGTGGESAGAGKTPEGSTTAGLATLSEREREIAQLLLEGLDNSAICERICVTESTLRTHLRNMYAKLDVHSRGELVRYLAERR